MMRSIITQEAQKRKGRDILRASQPYDLSISSLSTNRSQRAWWQLSDLFTPLSSTFVSICFTGQQTKNYLETEVLASTVKLHNLAFVLNQDMNLHLKSYPVISKGRIWSVSPVI